MSRCYSELIKLDTFEERLEYLQMIELVGDSKWGGHRYINQRFYTSKKWREFRHDVIIRDQACDMGLEGYDIFDMVIIHHIDPVTEEDILEDNPKLYDLENVICVSDRTHRLIHYGGDTKDPAVVERRPGDTTLW